MIVMVFVHKLRFIRGLHILEVYAKRSTEMALSYAKEGRPNLVTST